MSSDEDVQTLARIDVTRPSAADSTSVPSQILSVTRVTLPSFEVVYRDRAGALEHGQILLKDSAIRIDWNIDERDGTEVVLELSVVELPFSVTLLFRIVGSGPGHTLLEWWARRQTDPQLLELWISALQASEPTQQGTVVNGVTSEDVQEAMEIYRRVLASSPFDILGLHWTADAILVEEARSTLLDDFAQRLASCGQDESVARYLLPSAERVEMAAKILSSLEGRRRVREQIVPEKERGNAHHQAQFLLQMAERNGQPAAANRARAMLNELS